MSGVLEKTVSAVLAVAAIAIVSLEVRREFAPRPPAAVGPGPRPSVHVEDWRDMLPAAHLIGDERAKVTLIVFTDFQCPFCRRFDSVVAKAREAFPNSFTTALIHMPLAMHEAADGAARTAECVGASGRFERAVSVLYANQDSLGKLPWTTIARRAGVSDTISFLRCMSDSSSTEKVRLGAAMARERGVNSTPTVLLNGWRYSIPPSETELIRAIGDILDGKVPYPGFPLKDLARR